MRFMNEYDIEAKQYVYAGHPILGPAMQTLVNLVDWTNSNSDGWAYWSKPVRAAAKVMELIEQDYSNRYDRDRADVTLAEYRKALVPIKAFRTRQGASFEVVEVGA